MPDERPILVMLCNAQTPYRLALHLRLAREIPEARLLSVFTHDISNAPWKIVSPPEIGPLEFGKGQDSGDAAGQPLREWKKAGEIIQLFQREKPALVVVHGYNDLGRLRILRWCRANRVSAYLWADSNARSDTATGVKRAIKGAVLRWVFRQTDGVMTCGRLGNDFFAAYGADRGRMIYVPYEPDYAHLASTSGDAARSTFNLPDGRRRIIYSGRLIDVKRVDLLINAFNRIAHQRPEWDLVILGDGPLKEELRKQVDPTLSSRVSWLGFQSDPDLVFSVYRNCDLLCLPSSYEPWAVVINEAAAAGLAIIASNVVGAAAELVQTGVNGDIFTSGSREDLEKSLLACTAPDTINRLKTGSSRALADWRQRGDPVEGIRKAFMCALRG